VSDGVLQTEFPFTLPQGYVDDAGDRHREGTMRLATAADEIKPLRDSRVKANPSYLSVILLSRVVTSLEGVDDVTPGVIEGLFVADLQYLQSLYERVNAREADAVDATCPSCGDDFELHLDGRSVTGGNGAAPVTDPLAEALESDGGQPVAPPEANPGNPDGGS